tara:strand:+ start:142 stop:1071 length:930 start_codon:yes stop_codon:yes gene_type:complete
MSEDLKENQIKIKKADLEGFEGYYLNSSLTRYDTFAPSPYSSLVNLIIETLENTESKRVLEIGCGDGFAAHQIKEQIPDISYDVINATSPKPKEEIHWVGDDIDEFQSDLKYDVIFSINGLIHGYDDQTNFFKFANMLNKNGILTFNFDSITNPLELTKKSKFRDILGFYGLDALNEADFRSYCTNFGGRFVFLGKKISDTDLDEETIVTKSKELRQAKTTSYLVTPNGPQVWYTFTEKPLIEIENAIHNLILDYEERHGYRPRSNEEMHERQRIIEWIQNDSGNAMEFKFPLSVILYERMKDHPMHKN